MDRDELIDMVLLSLGSKMRLQRRAGAEDDRAERLRLLLGQLRAQRGGAGPVFAASVRQISSAVERDEYALAIRIAEGLMRK